MNQLHIRVRRKTSVGVEKRLFPKLLSETAAVAVLTPFSRQFLFFQETLQKHEAFSHLELRNSFEADCGF